MTVALIEFLQQIFTDLKISIENMQYNDYKTIHLIPTPMYNYKSIMFHPLNLAPVNFFVLVVPVNFFVLVVPMLCDCVNV